MIGEIEALLDEGVGINQTMFARPFARVQQHILDDGIRALAVLNNLLEILALQAVSLKRVLILSV